MRSSFNWILALTMILASLGGACAGSSQEAPRGLAPRVEPLLINYAPASAELTLPQAQPSRPLSTWVALPDGTALVMGGLEGGRPSPRVDRFDPITGSWERLGDLQEPRADHASVALYGGQVLLSGGLGPLGQDLRSAEIYLATEGVSVEIEEMVLARHGHSATLLRDGRVLIAGGQQDQGAGSDVALDAAEIYDPFEEGWYLTGMNSAGRSHHRALVMDDGRVRLQGGFSMEAGQVSPAVADEVFDPTLETWLMVAPGQEPPPRDDLSDPYLDFDVAEMGDEPGC